MTKLRELVTDRMKELGLSTRQAARRSAGQVSHGTLSAIMTGRNQGVRIRDETLRGIALALDLPLSQVEEAAQVKRTEEYSEFRLPREANRLTAQQRKAVLAMVKALLDASDSSRQV